MNQWIQANAPWLPQAIATIIAACGGASLAAVLAMRSFVKQRRWEKRADAYKLIMDALSQELENCEIRVAYANSGQMFIESPESQRKFTDARVMLWRASNVGSFIISERAAKLLEDHIKAGTESGKRQPETDIWQDRLSQSKKTLAALRDIAKREVQL